MFKNRKCRTCGDEYTPKKLQQQRCEKEHFKKCAYCNSDYPYNKSGKTCSTKCANALRAKTIHIKICLICNESFEAKHFNDKFCYKDHYSNCLACNKKFLITDKYKPRKTCSNSCASSLTHSEEAKQKRIETSRDRFGTDHPFQNEEVKAKVRLGIAGTAGVFGTEASKKAMLDKLGVENASQLESVKEKKRQTYLDKYGVDNPMKDPEIFKKYSDSIKKVFGVSHPSQINIKNYEDWINLKEFLENQDSKSTLSELSEYFNINNATISAKCKEENIQHLLLMNQSVLERKFEKFLLELPIVPNYVRNSRSVIPPKELDFYFPEHKLAVEISPTSTHAEDTLSFNGNAQKPIDYHFNKALECEKLGIQLITIFDWMKWDKVLEVVKNKLLVKQEVFLENCEEFFISKVELENESFSNFKYFSSKILKDFLENNFNTVYFNNSKNIFDETDYYSCIFYNNELVTVAGFIKNANYSSSEDSNSYNISFLTFKSGINVVNDVSRLLELFLENISENISSIEVFYDYNFGLDSELFSLNNSYMGALVLFEVKVIEPEVSFVHPEILDDFGSNFRVNFFSLCHLDIHNILKDFKGYVPNNLLLSLSDVFGRDNFDNNRIILEDFGFLKVWDCGSKKFTLSYE